MGTEIERKFLVSGEPWKDLNLRGKHYIQGYLSTERERTVRVRIAGEQAYITIKAPLSGISRMEYEYEIPVDEAQIILETMAQKPLIEKTRYHIPHEGMLFEVDIFLGENLGLVLAEIELQGEDQKFIKPDWLGEEVTNNASYYNSNLVHHPYSTWTTRQHHGS